MEDLSISCGVNELPTATEVLTTSGGVDFVGLYPDILHSPLLMDNMPEYFLDSEVLNLHYGM